MTLAQGKVLLNQQVQEKSPTDILRNHCNGNLAASLMSWYLLWSHRQSKAPAPLFSAPSKGVNPTSCPELEN